MTKHRPRVLLLDLASQLAPHQYGQMGLAFVCRTVMLLLAMLLGGCASLPGCVQRPVSVAQHECAGRGTGCQACACCSATQASTRG